MRRFGSYSGSVIMAGFTAIGHVNPVLDGAETQEQNRSDCQRLDDAVATTDHIAGELVTATPVQQDVHVRLGDAPGLGAALRDGAIRRQPVRPIRVGMKLRAIVPRWSTEMPNICRFTTRRGNGNTGSTDFAI